MKLGQQMKLAPRMIQSMEILQMPLLQLEERIDQELENNIALEIVEPGEGEGDVGVEGESGEGVERSSSDEGAGEAELSIDATSGADDFERLDTFNESNPEAAENEYSSSSSVREEHEPTYSRARLDGERDAKSDAMANTAARGASVQEQIREQWRLCDVDPRTRELGLTLIGFIEDDGYLRTPLADIADRTMDASGRATPEELERALVAMQLLVDPPGTGARDTRECLLLQLDALEEELASSPDTPPEELAAWEHVRVLIEGHLDDLAQNRLPKIVESSGLGLDEIKEALGRMRALSLAPARRLAPDETQVIIPDAIVEYDRDQDRYFAYLNDRRLPNLRVNREYALMSKDRAVEKPTREFIRKNLSNASWLIDAVEQRKRTLLRVLNVVVEAQRDFFDAGPTALRPLPMTQVAEQLGIHVATVSRAVADKHLETPRGMVALRKFFTGGTQTAGGEDVSWDAIKAALRDVIDAEDKSKPLSDDALAAALGERGIEIARRTVAKYRSQMDIPSARLRREF